MVPSASPQSPNPQIDDTVRREIQTHRRIYHTHIIAFKEAFLLPEHLAIVMEYASGGDMFNYVTTRKYADGTRGRLKEAEARWYFQQLILAVDYLHKMVCKRAVLLVYGVSGGDVGRRCREVVSGSCVGIAMRHMSWFFFPTVLGLKEYFPTWLHV